MGKETAIGWTRRPRPDGTLMPGHTFNPWWGCEKVSPACKHCYAEAFAKRTGHDIWGAIAPRRFFGPAHWNEPRRWNLAARAAGEKHLVFCASMADVLEDRPDLIEERERLTNLIEETGSLIWLLLTKRPENQYLLPKSWTSTTSADGWPKNVWFGATTENQEYFDARADHVASAGWAAARFLSIEPMLSPIVFDPFPYGPLNTHGHRWGMGIDWIIIGGESGAHRTELDLRHARDLAERARAASIAVYVKQDSGPYPGRRGRLSSEMWALKEFPR